MSRVSAHRVSRPLIIALAATIAIGASVYFLKHKPRSAAAHADQAKAIAPTQAIDSKSVELKAPLSRTPETKPSTPDTSLTSNNSGGLLNATPQSGLVTQTPTAGSTNNSASTSIASAGSVSDGSGPTTKPSGIAKNAVAMANNAPAFPPSNLGGNALPVTAGSLVQGRAEKEAGHLLTARELINNALLSGQLAEPDADAARQMLAEISHTMLFARTQIPGDPYTDLYQVQNGERLSRIAERHGVTWELLLKANGIPDARKIQAGRPLKLINGPFHAVVNKNKFRLDVYLGNPGGANSMFVMSFPVGLGKDNSTPTGMWIVQQGNKAHPATYYSPRGEGVFAADDPKNPLGGYWMGITGLEGEAVGKSSYGIHGTIEPDSVGKQSSMGCIRLKHDDIAFLYDLLVEGKSKVLVKD